MPFGMDAVKTIEGALALGFSVPEAVQRALDITLTAFADEEGFKIQEVSMCLRNRRPYTEIRDKLCARLQISREFLDRCIDEQRDTEPVEDVA